MRGEERLVGDLRARHPRSMSVRERGVVAAMATAYTAAAAACAMFLDWNRDTNLLTVAGVIVLFAFVSRVEFEIGSITAVATSLVFVPMLFLVPLPSVPLIVPAGYALAMIPDFVQRKKHVDRWVYAIEDAW